MLLSDPHAVFRFEAADVVLPLVVLNELEGKRHHPELGWAARTALRHLEQLRITFGSLHEGVPLDHRGGTLRVELNHQDTSGLPTALVDSSNDHRILTVAHSLAAAGRSTTLVTKDLPLRLKAAVLGLDADDHRAGAALDPEWTGCVSLTTTAADIDDLYSTGVLALPAGLDLPCHTGVVLSCGSQSALARIGPDAMVHLVQPDADLFGVRGRNAEQRIAIDLLADPDIGIVSLGGRAGTGKSVLALAAGLESVVERNSHRKVMVFRPLYPVGGQDLGYLPGDENDKMSPWAAAVRDALEAVCSPLVMDEVIERRLLEIAPLTHIRGRSLNDTFVIVDEAQNLERSVLLTALSRLGRNSRVVLTHDVAQRDNLRVGRHDGIASVIDALRGHPLFAHITLQRAERSAIASLVTDLLDTEVTHPTPRIQVGSVPT